MVSSRWECCHELRCCALLLGLMDCSSAAPREKPKFKADQIEIKYVEPEIAGSSGGLQPPEGKPGALEKLRDFAPSDSVCRGRLLLQTRSCNGDYPMPGTTRDIVSGLLRTRRRYLEERGRRRRRPPALRRSIRWSVRSSYVVPSRGRTRRVRHAESARDSDAQRTPPISSRLISCCMFEKDDARRLIHGKRLSVQSRHRGADRRRWRSRSSPTSTARRRSVSTICCAWPMAQIPKLFADFVTQGLSCRRPGRAAAE